MDGVGFERMRLGPRKCWCVCVRWSGRVLALFFPFTTAAPQRYHHNTRQARAGGDKTPRGEELMCAQFVDAFARCADAANAEVFKTKLDS